MQELLTSQFWLGLGAIIWVNIILSGDNAVVIVLAAVAKGSVVLLVLGLLISIPLVVYGATLLMKLMERYPVIITIGAALIGYVAGEMLVTDPIVIGWFESNAHWMIDFEVFSVFGYKFELSGAGLIGVVLVVAAGKWLAKRKEGAAPQAPADVPKGGRIVDADHCRR